MLSSALRTSLRRSGRLADSSLAGRAGGSSDSGGPLCKGLLSGRCGPSLACRPICLAESLRCCPSSPAFQSSLRPLPWGRGIRYFSVRPSTEPTWRDKEKMEESERHMWWIAAFIVFIFGGVFALVPLYKIYCQQWGQGQAVQSHREYEPAPVSEEASKRLITVDFAGCVHDALPWEFVPQQRRVVVGLGETCLAFYRARNTTDRPIIGVSVYHMIPPETGLYFNKIQCFCFDEQLINPHEEVDLPIFFFIDPLMAQDSRFDHVERMTLSYLFFESDSELPEEYKEFMMGSRSKLEPPVLDAPAPETKAEAVAPEAAKAG
mmetsp:Transcript_49497/g.107778  ORF Transcript_49497/g.107778 Transcript_49497/m.107778 type:complete len:320 (+) Transcript_49497:34-993(+)